MAKKKRRKWRRKHKDKHHIIPSSRGGSGKDKNITYVDAQNHNVYHQLFKNKTPEEIIVYLVEVFWKKDWQYVINALKEV